MRELKFKIRYCCGNRFKKLYGKYIRSIKKQFGKKNFKMLEICYNEKIENEFTLSGDYVVCQTCKRKYRKMDATYGELIIRIPDGM